MKIFNIARVGVLMWADILAGYIMWMMMTYLTNVWKINFIHAAGILNVFWGLVLMMPLFFRFIVDTLIGNYWMLALSCLSYSAGLCILTLSVPPVLSDVMGTCNNEYKPECISQGQEILFYTALALIAFGMAGHFSSFGGFLDDQIKQTGPSESEIKKRDSVLYYLSIFAVYLLPIIGTIAIPFIQPWSIRFGIPAICTMIATIIFLTGSCSYNFTRPEGDDIKTVFMTLASKILPMIPIYMTFIVLGVVSSIGYTFFMEQANHMNSKVGYLSVPIAILLLFTDLGKNLAKLVCKRIPPRLNIAVSMIVASLCCVTAAGVETRRRHGLIDDKKFLMSMFWLVPQFTLLGCFEGTAETSIVSFFKNPFPPSMMKYMSHIAFGILGVGHIGGVVAVYIVGMISEWGGKPSWFQHTLDQSRLDKYYWTLASLAVVNLYLYILVAICYATRKSTQSQSSQPTSG